MKKKTLDEKKISQITEKLGVFLSDTFVLYVKTLNFHWNMTGAEFFMYHKLLEKQYKELADAIDEIAERIRMLGKKTPASMADFLALTTLKESKPSLSLKEMVRELVKSHEFLIEHCHEIIRFTDSVEDEGTSDLVIDRLRSHAKEAWLLRSHLDKE